MKPAETWAAENGIPVEVVHAILADGALRIAITTEGELPPRSPVELRLSIGAESRLRCAQVLEDLADRIRHGENHHHPIGPSSVWGGAGSHGHHELSVDESITPEAYEARLQQWAERRREAARDAGGAS